MGALDRMFLREAHRHSSRNREEIEKSAICGCFFCLEKFPSGFITEWMKEPRKEGKPDIETAHCPNCGDDTVIGDASGIDITPFFLEAMYQLCFSDHTSRRGIRPRDRRPLSNLARSKARQFAYGDTDA